MNRRTWSLVALTSVLTVGAAAGLRDRSVTYHGATVSTDVTVINGHPYVPLADMARALGGKVVQSGGNYEIVVSGSSGSGKTAAGGANQVEGEHGKVGDMLFNGYWRFQVKGVERMDHYNWQYSGNSGSNKPANANDELVVLTCLIKNGHKDAEQPILQASGTSAQKTALADDQGQSYQPLDFDVRPGYLTPGAGKTFAVIFSVPKGTHLKDLIFTLYGFGSSKPSNVRISLNQ